MDGAWPLEPDAETLREMTQLVSEFVVDHVASLAEQPSFDLDGVEAVRASFREGCPSADGRWRRYWSG